MRMKIIAGNLAAVLVVGLLSYWLVTTSLESALVSEVDGRVNSDFELLSRSFRLSARELAELVNDQASQRPMVDVFLTALDEAARRERAYNAADRVAAWLTDPARRGAAPDIVVVLDDSGRVVARNADRNRMYGDRLTSVSGVRSALAGETATSVWSRSEDNTILQIAVAPIRNGGSVLGALLVGYDVSNGLAQNEATLIGRDVAFVTADQVYSSSLEEGVETEALRARFNDENGQAMTRAALEQGAESSPFTLDIGGSNYIAVVGPAPSGGADAGLAMVILANRSAARGKASVTSSILIFTAVGVLIVLVYGFMIGTSFLTPIEQMEETVLAVINGRGDLRIDIHSQEFGGLAYRINQLLNVMTGTPEEDEQGRVSTPNAGSWSEDEDPKADAGASAPGDTEQAAKLAAEPEDEYYQRVYREYVAAKREVGEDVSNIPQEKFVQRLKANESTLMQRNQCRMVRFEVETNGNQVNLKPVIIR